MFYRDVTVACDLPLKDASKGEGKGETEEKALCILTVKTFCLTYLTCNSVVSL